MQIRAKRILPRVAIAMLIAFVAIWGMGKIVSGVNNSVAVACNPEATNINDAVCLQDLNDTIKATMDVETHYMLDDSRDGNSYFIAKLDDGNVWMTQNLNLGNTASAIDLNPTNTDIGMNSTFTTLPEAESFVESDYYTVDEGYIEGDGKYIMTSGSWARDIVRDFGSSHYRLGNGYPWAVATAQTTSYVDPTDQTDIDPTAPDSICPAGWKLPSQAEYRNLLETYELFEEGIGTEGSEETSSALRNEPLVFIRGYPNTLGTDGQYWTSTTALQTGGSYDYYKARVFFISGTESGTSYRTENLSGVTGMVRCIARPDSSFSFTLSYNTNGGTGSIESDVVSSNRKQVDVIVSDAEPTRANHAFVGWAESSSATAADYVGGDTIELGDDKTLYAVWEVEMTGQVVSFEQSSVSKTFGDSDFTNVATTTGDGAITYSSNNTNVAEVNSSTGKVTIVGAGTATITANAAATTYYTAASATYTLTVSKATPTVSFTNTAVNKTYGDANFTNLATATSGGTITYQSGNTDVATINSNTGEVTIVGAGTATITANAAATANYTAASNTYTLTVSKVTPTVSFANTAVTKTYGDAKFTNAATTISDGAITYSSNNTGVATINVNTGEVTIISAGTATITANAAATANYTAASATYTLTVNKKVSVAPSEVSETKNGYVDDTLSTIALNTSGLAWSNSAAKIKEGYNGYAVNYTENNDTHNYTTESFEITVNGERRPYAVIEGDGQTYTQKGDQDIIKFKINADYSLFESDGKVYIDGLLVDPQYYTAESDNNTTVLSISKDYLETLTISNHSLSVYFGSSGVAEATFVVVEKSGGEEEPKQDEEEETLPVPNTGGASSDNHGNSINALLCMLPGGVIAGILIGRYVCRAKKAHRKFEW